MRLAVVTSICVPFDAISQVARQTVLWAAEAGHEVRLFAYRCGFDDVPATEVGSAGELAVDPFYRTCDVAIFHLGIYYGLFGALLARPARARLLVRFHNVTPRELVPSWSYDLIDRSQAQVSLLRFADEIHSDSAFSLEHLGERGIETPAVVRDLAATVPIAPPADKPSHRDGVLRLVFVGRFVRSKGVVELLDALDEALPAIVQDQVHLDLVGNVEFSDADYLAEVRRRAAGLAGSSGSRVQVRIHGSAPDDVRNDLLASADVFVLPTYHEGFCVPVVEALASGCEVISYDNSNLPDVTGGLATLVPTGDVHALGEALVAVADRVSCPDWVATGYRDAQTLRRAHLDRFEPERVRRRLLADLDRWARPRRHGMT